MNRKIAILLGCLLASPSFAEVPANLVHARLLPGWTTATGTRMVAIQLDLAPGWKTYWRSPGEAGLPPVFDWAGSGNLGGVQVHWPRPVVFQTNGFQTIGYHDQLILPVELTPGDPAAGIGVKLNLQIGVCKDVCVPVQLELSGEIAKGGAKAPAIQAALADQPGPMRGAKGISCAVEPIADGLRVTARMMMPPVGPEETVVLENAGGGVWVSEAMALRDGGQLTATADMVPENGAPFALDRSDIRITVLSGGAVVETQGCPAG